MFTGLVAELGTVQNLARQGNSYHLTVQAKKVMDNLKIGDSVAVNGACLTVVKMSGDSFTADVMPETVRLTNIGELANGSRVNLERTLRLCDGLDGHIVSGHVEGLGTIVSQRPEGIAVVVTVQTPPELLRYIITKGSIAIDGISLTVTQVTDTGFSVSLIPHTAKETTLGFKRWATRSTWRRISLASTWNVCWAQRLLQTKTRNNRLARKCFLLMVFYNMQSL